MPEPLSIFRQNHVPEQIGGQSFAAENQDVQRKRVARPEDEMHVGRPKASRLRSKIMATRPRP
jgi:hypothetical protein